MAGIGAINSRGFNPFQDAGSLIRANGIAESANPFVEAIVRNEMNAPQTLRPEDYRVNPFGRLAAETNPGQDIAQTLTSGLPQGQLALTLAGQSPYPNAPSAGIATGRFAGINRMTPEDIKRIMERTKAARALVAGTGPAKTATAKKKDVSGPFMRFSGRDFQPVR